MVNKRPTRLAESVFFSFVPAPASMQPDGWSVQVLGSQMDPTDTLGKVGSSSLTSTYGGSPHLRGVEAARWSGTAGAFSLTSLDVPVLCMGKASPFDTPRTEPPDMRLGVHYNIFQNVWNTNCAWSYVEIAGTLCCRDHLSRWCVHADVLWYPFDEADKHTRSRFRMVFE